jgi:hypothetical protein
MPHPSEHSGESVPCPSCIGGTFTTAALVRHDDGVCRLEEIECRVCDNGVVSRERLDRILTGKKLRRGRLAARRSLSEEATRLGVTIPQLSAAERSKSTLPVPEGARATE